MTRPHDLPEGDHVECLNADCSPQGGIRRDTQREVRHNRQGGQELLKGHRPVSPQAQPGNLFGQGNVVPGVCVVRQLCEGGLENHPPNPAFIEGWGSCQNVVAEAQDRTDVPGCLVQFAL